MKQGKDLYTITAGNTTHQVSLNDLQNADYIRQADGSYHFLHQHHTHRVQILQADFQAKTLEISVDGTPYQVSITDHFDRLVKELGLGVVTTKKMSELHAPMPGLVLNIDVSPGDTISEGTPLLILEAMKMENVLKAAGDAVVKEIKVKKGDAVEKGELLITFE